MSWWSHLVSFTSPLHPFSVRHTVPQGHSGMRHIRSQKLLKVFAWKWCCGMQSSRINPGNEIPCRAKAYLPPVPGTDCNDFCRRSAGRTVGVKRMKTMLYSQSLQRLQWLLYCDWEIGLADNRDEAHWRPDCTVSPWWQNDWKLQWLLYFCREISRMDHRDEAHQKSNLQVSPWWRCNDCCVVAGRTVGPRHIKGQIAQSVPAETAMIVVFLQGDWFDRQQGWSTLKARLYSQSLQRLQWLCFCRDIGMTVCKDEAHRRPDSTVSPWWRLQWLLCFLQGDGQEEL